MHPRDAAGWDRAAELQAIRETYDHYDRTERSRLWNRSDPGYARLVNDIQGRLRESLLASVPAAGGRVLDLGCGDGDLAVESGTLDAEWIGIDLRPEAVERATARFPDLKFIVASADAVPLDDASVDVVVARVLFSSLPSDRLEAAVAAEIRRLLRSDGWLVWLDIRYANPANRAVHAMTASRISRLFPGWHRELHPSGLLPPIARRLGHTAPVAYPALAVLPFLRSHLVGRLGPPRSP